MSISWVLFDIVIVLYRKIRFHLTKMLIKLLHETNKFPLSINWDEIVDFQVKCLKDGANGSGIPNLIIAQNAKQNGCKIYSLDKHFKLLSQVLKIKLYV